MRTLFVPASGSWSFPPEEAPVSWVPGSDGGELTLDAVTDGSSPVDGEGVIFSVILDGILVYTSACMENGSDTVPVPPGTLTIEVTVVKGCNGGPDETRALVSGVAT